MLDQASQEKSLDEMHLNEDTNEDNEQHQDSETPMNVVPDVSSIFKFDFKSLQDVMDGFQEKIDSQSKKLKHIQAE